MLWARYCTSNTMDVQRYLDSVLGHREGEGQRQSKVLSLSCEYTNRGLSQMKADSWMCPQRMSKSLL